MIEPAPEQTGPPPRTPTPSSPPEAARVPPLDAEAVAQSDNTPTIISKSPPRPIRGEEPFMATLRGRCLAHFELIEPIGMGGMAAVIRARDTQLDRYVALKILPPEMASDPEMIRRFHQEARAAARLDHENIARVFFCGEDQGLHFISFEFVEGENLRTILDRRGRLPVPQAVHYMLQVATGLAHAAARGVVHRDIKPSNIIISPNGRAKLVDMGLARSLEAHRDNALTQSGVTLGTFDYISPEQALEPREADVRSDIYSLGCTFYHMLTGQPPVPEGTAAKKLHHHQHVAPVDPRQLNADIPDEVAAVLARMMAKDPKDRYQRPEHLVQHLLQLAQKLGGGAEIPEGMLFVDAPLPGPPRLRPLVVGTVAVAVLVALVLLQTMVPWHASQPRRQDVAADAGTRQPADQPDLAKEGPAGTAAPAQDISSLPAPPLRAHYEVKNARELAAALANKDASADILLLNDIDLSEAAYPSPAGPLPGLFFQGQGREVAIQPKDPNSRPVIKLAYDTARIGEDAWVGFTMQGGKVTFKGLRFEINARAAPKIKMAALKVQKQGELYLSDCEIVQINPPVPSLPDAAGGWVSSVVLEATSAEVPKLHGRRCLFLGRQEENGGTPLGLAGISGQQAVMALGSAEIDLQDCAFGPHAALFHFRKKSALLPLPQTSRADGRRSDLTLLDCSALLVQGSIFQVDDDMPCGFKVHRSVWSRPESSAGIQDGSAVLIAQQGKDFELHYDGQDNRYHNLSAFCMRSGAEEASVVASSWEDFQRLNLSRAGDIQSKVLTASPWKETDPLRLLAQDKPDLAFQLDVRQADLRRADRPESYLVGVQDCTWGQVYPEPPPRLQPRPAEAPARTLIVDPKAKASNNGVYPSLSQAILDAKPGDVISIRHTGLLHVEPVRLEKSSIDVTIKPYRGYQPILTLAERSEPDAFLFRLHDGKLKLEQLEFLLRPQSTEFKSQVIVALAGVGQCFFKECVITLDSEVGGEVRLAAVALSDPKDMMKMGSPPADREAPEIRLETSFVRGKGDLLMIRASRALDLVADSSLFALAGSFLSVEGNSKDVGPQAVKISLDHITAYMAGHLLVLRTKKDVKDLSPLEVSSDNSLFASGGGKSLVHFDGEITDVGNIKRHFSWKGKDNAYSNFVQMLDQQPGGETMMPLGAYGTDKWADMSPNDDKPAFPRVKFLSPPPDEHGLSKVLPGDLRVKPDADNEPSRSFGADISKLPRPALEKRTEAGTASGHD